MADERRHGRRWNGHEEWRARHDHQHLNALLEKRKHPGRTDGRRCSKQRRVYLAGRHNEEIKESRMQRSPRIAGLLCCGRM